MLQQDRSGVSRKLADLPPKWVSMLDFIPWPLGVVFAVISFCWPLQAVPALPLPQSLVTQFP